MRLGVGRAFTGAEPSGGAAFSHAVGEREGEPLLVAHGEAVAVFIPVAVHERRSVSDWLTFGP